MKKYRVLMLFIAFLIVSGFYKPIVLYLFPSLNTYQAKLMEEVLQAVTILAFITGMKLWRHVGRITKISKKSIQYMLPIIIVSVLPLFNGLATIQATNIIMLIIISFIIGLSEELACRGVLLHELKHLGKIKAIAFSSLIFGALHFMNLFKGASFEETIIQVLFAAGFGLTMAIVRYKTQLILPQILVHALWDFNSKISGDGNSDLLNTLIYISFVIVILWGIFLTIREWKMDLKQCCESLRLDNN